MLETGGSHKWVTQVFTEGSILAGECTHLAKDTSDPCPHYQNHNDWFPKKYGGNLTDRPVFPPPTLR